MIPDQGLLCLPWERMCHRQGKTVDSEPANHFCGPCYISETETLGYMDNVLQFSVWIISDESPQVVAVSAALKGVYEGNLVELLQLVLESCDVSTLPRMVYGD